MPEQSITFGTRLRQIRKGMELSQEEFAKKLGTTKQVLSRYETNKRTPKITIVKGYAEKLGVSGSYLLGEAEELYPQANDNDKSSFAIFVEVTKKMKLNIEGTSKKTGFNERQIRMITDRQDNDLPFLIAWHLTETLGVPMEVWMGDMVRQPPYITMEAREIAFAFDQADVKCRMIVRMALDLYFPTNIYS